MFRFPGIEICLRYDVDDPVEFVEQWMAFSVSKLSGAEPTVEYLREMESHEYSNKVRKVAPAAAVSRMRQSAPRANDFAGRSGTGSGGLTIYSNAEAMDSIENDVLVSYGCITPKVSVLPVFGLCFW